MIPSSAQAITTKEEFASEFHAQKEACYLLWDALEEGTAIIETTEYHERNLCGTIYPPATRSRFAVICEIARSEGIDAYLVRNGGSTREVHALLSRRDRLQERHRSAVFGGVEDDADELKRVIEVLGTRTAERHDLDTSFDEEWLPKTAAKSIIVRASSEESEELPGFAKWHPDQQSLEVE